ncbi:MAG: NAD(P)/FAD-dependent oxidoreductase [Deltaproteobacteria bacterium]
MAQKIVVIGAGPGGYVAAIRAAQLGAEVTVIQQERVGGTCLHWGCIPSKVMKTTAELLDRCRRSQEFGVAVQGDLFLDMKALMARKEAIVEDQVNAILKLFNHHRIRHLSGYGTIKGPGLCEAKLANGCLVEEPWDGLVLALGSKPLQIPHLPFDGAHILSSNDALKLEDIPESLLIVGGGVIGCEFAFIFSSLGSRVTVVEAFSRLLPLPSVDEDCSKTIQREMKKRKIRFMVNRTVQSVDIAGGKCRAAIGPSPYGARSGEKNQKPFTEETDKILVCIGRESNTAGIGLEKIGAKVDNAGWVMADEHMEAGISHIYAVGDALGPSKFMLAHVATREGLIAAENITGGRRTMNYDVVPGVIFTTPEVANVGLTESQAREKGLAVRSDSMLFRNLGKPHVIGEIAGEAKIVWHKETGKMHDK